LPHLEEPDEGMADGRIVFDNEHYGERVASHAGIIVEFSRTARKFLGALDYCARLPVALQ
jgi:hypothetical protein